MKEVVEILDRIDERLDSVDKTLIKQELNLKEHMRRTELLEAQHDKLYLEIEPVKAHVNQVKAGIKIIAFIIPAVGALIAALWNIKF